MELKIFRSSGLSISLGLELLLAFGLFRGLLGVLELLDEQAHLLVPHNADNSLAVHTTQRGDLHLVRRHLVHVLQSKASDLHLL